MHEKKYKNIIINYLAYFITFIIIILYGSTHVSALETKTIYSVNNNGTLSSANTYNYGYMSGGVQNIGRATVGNTVSGVAYGFNFTFYENIVLNKTYTLVINFKDLDLLKSFNSNMVQISTCNNTTCNENILVSITKSSNTGNSNKLTLQFNPVSTGAIILVNLGSDQPITGTSTFGISSVILDSSNQNEDIMNNANQNANNIINNQNSNTQDIIDSSASNTEDIINNQNQNTQDIIDNQYTCNIQTITNYNGSKNVALNSTGQAVNADNFVISDYIKLYSNKTYTLTKENWGSSRAYCLYNNSKELISCSTYGTSTSFTITGADYIRYTWSATNNRTVNLYGDICLKDSKEQTNAINDLNDTLNDSSGPDTSSFSNVSGWLPAGPIDSILTLPLALYNAYNNSLNSTCTDLTLPIPFVNQDIKIPCIRTLLTKIGIVQYWDTIGFLIAGVLLYNYLLNLYAWYDRVTSLKSTTLTGRDDFGGDV